MEQLIYYCPKCRGKTIPLETGSGVFGYECRKCDYGFSFIGNPHDCGKTTKIHHETGIVNNGKGTVYCPLCRGECDTGGYVDSSLGWHCKDDECGCQFAYIPNADEEDAQSTRGDP